VRIWEQLICQPSYNVSQGQIDPTSSDGSNLVQIWNNLFTQTGAIATRSIHILCSRTFCTGEDDALSSVLIVAPSLNASLIGAGPTGAPLQPLFGNTDFKAYNIDFQNRAVGYPRFPHSFVASRITEGKLFNQSSSGHGYQLRQCFILRLYLRQLSRHMVNDLSTGLIRF
jgi:hypothetical protein